MRDRLIVVVVGLVVLMAAGPTVICLARALVPLVLVLGAVVAAVRLVWFYTNRW